MPSSLDKLVEQVEALSVEDQRRLHKLLQEKFAAAREAASEDDFKLELVAEGLLSKIPPPITDLAPYRDRRTRGGVAWVRASSRV